MNVGVRALLEEPSLHGGAEANSNVGGKTITFQSVVWPL
jgi:hypothetical protein